MSVNEVKQQNVTIGHIPFPSMYKLGLSKFTISVVPWVKAQLSVPLVLPHFEPAITFYDCRAFFIHIIHKKYSYKYFSCLYNQINHITPGVSHLVKKFPQV